MMWPDPRLVEALDAENERDPWETPPREWDGVMPPERHTFDGWRQKRIAEGVCPRSYCLTPLEEGACPTCGWTLADERPLDSEGPRPVPWFGPLEQSGD